ncbi:MAG: BON domain-containing protein [Xanthomonadales bacterium]|nr:BON domain-containing protein [Xanthomonadales bacterium]
MQRTVLVCLLLCALTLLPGCVAAVVGTAAVAGGRVAHDRRSVSTMINDKNLQMSADNAIEADQALASHNHIRVVVYNRVILLVGEVVDAAARDKAGELASGFIGARRVVNQLDIAPEPGFWSRRGDNALAARIKTGLIDITSLPGFDPTRINITVAHNNVYLMGLLTHTEAKAVLESARSTSGVNKVFNLFDYIDAPVLPARASSTPAPASSVALPASSSSVTTYPIKH